MNLERRRISTYFPCCSGRSALNALVALPTEIYRRICPECRTKYRVIRRTMDISIKGSKATVDVIDWLDEQDREYREWYGVN